MTCRPMIARLILVVIALLPSSAWAVTAAPAFNEVKLTPSDGFPGDSFGAAVAISADTVVVGAPAAGGGAVGQVYVYVRNATTWSKQAKLIPNDGGGEFGTAVAISGNTIVV